MNVAQISDPKWVTAVLICITVLQSGALAKTSYTLRKRTGMGGAQEVKEKKVGQDWKDERKETRQEARGRREGKRRKTVFD